MTDLPFEPIKRTFTGQYSYYNPHSAAEWGVSDFGLHFYNARWYDSSIGRFAQADSIIPGGAQGLDRYAYTANNPVNFTDPSGHTYVCTGYFNSGQCSNWYEDGPDVLDESKLDKTPSKTTKVDGADYYKWYLELYKDKTWWWWKSHNTFTVWDFLGLMFSAELGEMGNPESDMYKDGYNAYREGAVRSAYQWCKENGCDASTPEGALNWMAAYSQSVASRYNTSHAFEQTGYPSAAGLTIANAIKDPGSYGHSEWKSGWRGDRPYGFGNKSLYPPGNYTAALNLNLIAWHSYDPPDGSQNSVVIPTGCGSYVLHGDDERDNYERNCLGYGKWPLK